LKSHSRLDLCPKVSGAGRPGLQVKVIAIIQNKSDEMRVRVVTNPPLPVLKAWFSVQSVPVTATVSDFKDQLCSGIRILHGLKKNDITLLLDDFQLLDEGPMNVIRDGDLI
jgi:hypothetical protein